MCLTAYMKERADLTALFVFRNTWKVRSCCIVERIHLYKKLNFENKLCLANKLK